ncbi:hypothetical protein AB6A40_006979 [Gnathostoma spinigerum]|uniref:Uncharacterized protein n=1 Tax=Gnathostoma spinigerum TaxID=75299 RepID=A0ABD6EJW8_9BILA
MGFATNGKDGGEWLILFVVTDNQLEKTCHFNPESLSMNGTRGLVPLKCWSYSMAMITEKSESERIAFTPSERARCVHTLHNVDDGEEDKLREKTEIVEKSNQSHAE